MCHLTESATKIQGNCDNPSKLSNYILSSQYKNLFRQITENCHFSDNIYVVFVDKNLFILLRESIPRKVDKKSGGPQGERGLEFSRKRKRTFFFPSTFLRIT